MRNNNHRYELRFTKEQFNRLKKIAQSRGYKTIAPYIRTLSLEYDSPTQKLIKEIHNKLIENERRV